MADEAETIAAALNKAARKAGWASWWDAWRNATNPTAIRNSINGD